MSSVSSNSSEFAAQPLSSDTVDEGALLRRFVESHDQQAFRSLMELHSGMVYGVCRRILRQASDADDAYQATFLILAREARKIQRPELLSHWLYQVAYRTALRLRTANSRRRLQEKVMESMGQIPSPAGDLWPEVEPWLDRALNSLPEKYRIAVICCDLEGKTHREAAQQLGLPQGTLSTRLVKAHEILAKRLKRWGIVVSSGTLALLLIQNAASAAVSPPLLASTAATVGAITSGQTAASVVPAQVLALTKGGLSPWTLAQAVVATVAALSVAVAAAALQQEPPAKPAARPVGVIPRPVVEVEQTDLEKLGGVLIRDLTQPERPVIRVHFQRNSVFGNEHVHLLKELTKLRSLRLGYTKVTEACLGELAALPELQSLDLAQTWINGGKLQALSRFPNLTSLHLHKMKLQDDSLKELEPLHKLMTLDLRETGISDLGLKHLQSFPDLEFLYIDSNAITDTGLKELVALKKLRHLSIDDNRITNAGLEEIGKIESLELLSAPQTLVTDAGLKHLKNLIHINVGHTRVTDAGLVQLADFPRLQQLRLAGKMITDVGIPHLEKLQQLTTLELNNTGITQQGLQNLEAALTRQTTITTYNNRRKTIVRGGKRDAEETVSAPPVAESRPVLSPQQSIVANAQAARTRLQQLGATFTTSRASDGSETVSKINLSKAATFRDEHTPLLMFFVELTALDLSQTLVTDAPFLENGIFSRLAIAGAYRKLSVLRLAGLPVSDLGVQTLGKLTSLETLDMGQTHLTDAGLAHLRDLPALATLILGKNVITNNGLAELAGFRNLKTLDVSATQISDDGLLCLQKLRYLENLDVSSNQITDAGLTAVGQLTTLTTLNLHATQISDAGCKHLQNLTNLTSLDVGRNRFSETGLMELASLEKLQFVDATETRVNSFTADVFKQTINKPRLAVKTSDGNSPAAATGTGTRQSRMWWLVIANGVVVAGLVVAYLAYRRYTA